MRALLIFYLTQHFLFDDAMSAGIYATYGAMVYLMPVLGGMIADRYLGFRKAVIVGAVLLCCGHLGMAFEGDPARSVEGVVVRDSVSLQVLYLSLAFIVIGVGFLKSSISNMVGELYGPDDPRRDGGFTLFYMGINWAPSSRESCAATSARPTAGATVSDSRASACWRDSSPSCAAAGSCSAPASRRKARTSAVPCSGGITREHVIWGAALVAVLVMWQILQYQRLVGGMLLVGGGAVVVGVIWFSLARCTPVERDRTLVVLGLTAVSVVFWALFEQAGSSMSLFADRNVDRDIAGVTAQASQFQSLNPLFIIFLAPLFAGLWPMLARRGREPGTPAKFGLGIVQIGLGFAVLVYGCTIAGEDRLVAAGWLAFGLPAAHHRGTVPVPGGALDGDQALRRPDCGHDDGRLVPVGGVLPLRRRHHRGGPPAWTRATASTAPPRSRFYADTFEYLALVALGVGVARAGRRAVGAKTHARGRPGRRVRLTSAGASPCRYRADSAST